MTFRAVLDANIFISYLLAPDDARGTIVQVFESIASGQYQMVRSDRLIAEIRSSVAQKPKLRNRISDVDLEELIALIEEVSLPFDHDLDVHEPPILRDRKDSYLLEAAIGANADSLVSGDRDLRVLQDQFERPRIVTPREFLEILDRLPS